MTRQAKLYTTAIGAILAICALLSFNEWAHSQGGGFPSFPYFSAVNINSAQSTANVFACGSAGNTPLCVFSGNSQNAATFIGSTTTNQSGGVLIDAGTSGLDQAFNVTNAAGATTLFKVYGDGGITGGSGTSDEGLGTINVSTAIYINNANIFASGTFTPTDTSDCTGFSSAAWFYSKSGSNVVLYATGAVTCTSSGTGFTMSGLPAAVTPSRSQAYTLFGNATNAGAASGAACTVTTSSTIICAPVTPSTFTTGSWTASGTKSLGSPFTINYSIN